MWQVGLGPAHGDQRLLPGSFEGAPDESVLGFDRVKLAPGPVGLEARPLNGQLEGSEALGVHGVGIGQGLGGGDQRGRFQHGEDLIEHTGFQPAPAEALAHRLGAIEHAGLPAHVAGTVALGARVGGLHHAPASPASQPSLQQRRSLVAEQTDYPKPVVAIRCVPTSPVGSAPSCSSARRTISSATGSASPAT